MEQTLSNKIKIGGVLCTILVVLRHSLNLQAFGLTNGNGALAVFIEQGVSKQTEIAVPFFFIISGFFFFRHTYYGKGEYLQMITKKWRSLFIPFLCWNLIGMVVLLVTRKFVFGEDLWRYGIQLLHSDWNGVLWYVRDIMTMMMLVPIYGWIFMVNSKWLYIILFIGLFSHWLPVDCSWISSEGLLFFFLGGVLQQYSDALKWRMPKYGLWPMTAIWLISCFMYPCYWSIHKYNTLLGIFIYWQLLDRLPPKWNLILLEISSLSFFVYVVHIDILRALKVSVAHIFPYNEPIALLSFFILPMISVLLAIIIGKTWNKFSPKTFAWVTGGRA